VFSFFGFVLGLLTLPLERYQQGELLSAEREHRYRHSEVLLSAGRNLLSKGVRRAIATVENSRWFSHVRMMYNSI